MPIELGDCKAQTTWIYLCGLNSDFHNSFATNNRALLDEIGKELHIKIIALPPKDRSPDFGNQLHWPHESDTAVLQTYDYIKELTKEYTIDGFIGLSNGGFFLHELMQQVPITAPIISIGASGQLHEPSKYQPKSLTLIIGKQDTYHYAYTVNFANQAKAQSININLIEHDDGHIIPKVILKKTLKKLIRMSA